MNNEKIIGDYILSKLSVLDKFDENDKKLLANEVALVYNISIKEATYHVNVYYTLYGLNKNQPLAKFIKHAINCENDSELIQRGKLSGK